VARDRKLSGLKHADREMGPASGTLCPQQAGSREGSGAPAPEKTSRIRGGYAHKRDRCEERSDLAIKLTVRHPTSSENGIAMP